MKEWTRIVGLLALLMLSAAVHATTEWDAQDYDLYSGDFDGDGKSDILYIAKDPSMPSGIARSDGTAPNIAWQSWASNLLGINWPGNAYNVIVADFNADSGANVLLHSVSPVGSLLLLVSTPRFVVGISQHIANTNVGITGSSAERGQHRAHGMCVSRVYRIPIPHFRRRDWREKGGES